MVSRTSEWLAERIARQEARKHPAAAPAEFFQPDPGPEIELRELVRKQCELRRWILFTGSTAHRAFRTIGEPDSIIIADRGRVIFLELKQGKKKPTPEQLGFIGWAKLLGTTIHVPRSKTEILAIFDGPCGDNQT